MKGLNIWNFYLNVWEIDYLWWFWLLVLMGFGLIFFLYNFMDFYFIFFLLVLFFCLEFFFYYSFGLVKGKRNYNVMYYFMGILWESVSLIIYLNPYINIHYKNNPYINIHLHIKKNSFLTNNPKQKTSISYKL